MDTDGDAQARSQSPDCEYELFLIEVEMLHEYMRYGFDSSMVLEMPVGCIRAVVLRPEVPSGLEEKFDNHRKEYDSSLQFQARQHSSSSYRSSHE